MKVEKTIELGDGHKIEFGKATWNKLSVSVRNRYPTKKGGFSPRSSSEIPIDDVKIILIESVKNNYIPDLQLIEIAEMCLEKLKNKSENKNTLPGTEKIKFMQEASEDLLFLADINEITEDFNMVDNENV